MKKELASFVRALKSKLSGKNGNYPYVETFSLERSAFKYWITDDLYKEWYNPEAHRNWEETKAYLDFVDDKDHVLEIGCNNGFTTCLIKSLSGEGLVVGLDIVPENVMIAQAQVGLNRYTNCYVLNLGADDQKRKVRVQNTNNGFVVGGKALGSIEVDVIPGDDLIAEFGYFTILKIDVEGYEGNVLRGCKEILSRSPKLMIEMHGSDITKYDSSVKEIFDLIEVDRYEGFFCPRSTGKLLPFDKNTFDANMHATLFLKPKK